MQEEIREIKEIKAEIDRIVAGVEDGGVKGVKESLVSYKRENAVLDHEIAMVKAQILQKWEEKYGQRMYFWTTVGFSVGFLIAYIVL